MEEIYLKKICALFFAISLSLILSACSWSSPEETKNDGIFKIAMAPDIGGVNDKSFNQSAWEGLKELANEENVSVTYSESKQPSDFTLNLDKLSDNDFDLIWGIGFSMVDAVYDSATVNLDKNYAIVDYSYGSDTPNNVTCILFRAEESAFLTGYIAGKTTQTNKIGFLGGLRNPIVCQFECGYKAGAMYAAKELKKDIEVEVQYADSFSDCAKGRAIANKMYSGGCDILIHAAGGVGYGAIEYAKDNGKLIIGVDRDQSYLAPENMLTSAMKNVGQAVKIVSKKIMKGEKLGGTTLTFGIKDGCVGIPEPGKAISPKVYDDAIKLSKNINDSILTSNNKKFTIPSDDKSYETFLNELK